MPFGWAGVNWSASGFLFKELYPLTNKRDDKAAKQGFSWDKVIREKKLIWTTAII